ncbi:hypothetical protein BD626DRAFT_407541 [Schizophyllum amplum]|uniref:PARP-type domain-containing protein n=1 Tax=Schizophyllum amplum TaxID=97359 RepID=A0A550C699_9AGAR|nr:hypothetical protein BD626DRAFT_407541 [Auriculariopsis ampla]
MPGGYRLEYASSNRAKCKGPMPCKGSTISKGTLRLASVIDFRGNPTFAWRHWGCTTPKVLANIKEAFPDPSELDGYEELNDEDKERIAKAYEEGHVADEDIPETAQKGAEDDEEKPKKKAPAKKAKDADEDDAEEKPKRKRATKAQVRATLPLLTPLLTPSPESRGD